MTADKQIERIESLESRIEALEDQFEQIEDPTKAQLQQKQALDAAREDLRKAGSHVGYANANRHADDAENRIRGIEATLGL